MKKLAKGLAIIVAIIMVGIIGTTIVKAEDIDNTDEVLHILEAEIEEVGIEMAEEWRGELVYHSVDTLDMGPLGERDSLFGESYTALLIWNVDEDERKIDVYFDEEGTPILAYIFENGELMEMVWYDDNGEIAKTETREDHE